MESSGCARAREVGEICGLGVDDDNRRVAYSITESPFGFEFHSASMQIVPDDHGSCFRWVTDIKPDALAPQLAPVIDSQIEALRERLA